MIKPKIEHVCLKKIYLDSYLIRQFARLIQSQSHCVECCNIISVSRKKHRIFSFAAGYIKQAQRFVRRTDFHNFIAHIGRLISPIIPVRFISLLIIHDLLLLRRISEKRINITMKNICKKRQDGKIGG